MNYRPSEKIFDTFYKDELYLSLKRSLFNYKLRKWKIKRHVPDTGLILDIGSGIAPVSPDLGRTVLADISEEAIKNISAREKVVTSITNLVFDDQYFDCILCSEVLEHIEDDAKALSELRRVLKREGILIVTVPYLKNYWAEDDEYVGHARRYEPGELEKKLEKAGFLKTKTYKLSGPLERWMTKMSVRLYSGSVSIKKMNVGLLRSVNRLIFLFLLLFDSFPKWKTTSRILVVAK